VSCIRLNDVICARQRRDNNGAKATTSPRTYRATMAVERTNSWLSNFASCDGAPTLALASARADGTRSHAAADRQLIDWRNRWDGLKDAYSLASKPGCHVSVRPPSDVPANTLREESNHKAR